MPWLPIVIVGVIGYFIYKNNRPLGTPDGIQASSTPITPVDTSSDGMSKEYIQNVQMMLNVIGNYGLVLDGIIGPLTHSAISDFQIKQKLPVTGVYDLATYTALIKTYNANSQERLSPE